MSHHHAADGLWSLILARYAGNLHVIEHADAAQVASMVFRAQQENAIFEGLAVDCFPLEEALANVREFVENRSNFPP